MPGFPSRSLLAGLVCPGLSVITGLRHALLVGAPLFAICVLSRVLAGELTAPVARSAVRVTGPARRRLRDYVPVLPAVVLTALGGCLVLLLAASAADVFTTGQPGAAGCLINLVYVGGRPPRPGSSASLPTVAIGVAGSAWRRARCAPWPAGRKPRPAAPHPLAMRRTG